MDKKYLSIDYGRKRIGLAVGSIFPFGVGVIDREIGIDKVLDQLDKIIKENEIDEIVIGMPTKTDRKSDITEEIKNFSELLKNHFHKVAHYEPEDFTSVEAEAFMEENNKNYSRKSGKVDELAAILILEQFLKDKDVR